MNDRGIKPEGLGNQDYPGEPLQGVALGRLISIILSLYRRRALEKGA